MLGVKINEFDNSDGKVSSFNRIFPNTPLDVDKDVDVEILDIVDRGSFSNNLYMRNILVGDKNIEHDFGENNFYDNKDFLAAENVRFKYIATDLKGGVLAKAYSSQELADKLGVDVGVIKRRLVSRVNEGSRTDNLFNVERKEL